MRGLRRLGIASGFLILGWLISSAGATYLLLHRTPLIAREVAPKFLGDVIDVRLKTSDGESLGAWLIRGVGTRPIVIVLHGHNSSRSEETERIKLLADDGLGVLAVTARAQGDSTGEWCDVGWSSRKDVIAAVDYLEHETPGRSIVVLGTSMGAASAIFAAAVLGSRVKGYVLDSPYVSIERATELRLRERLPPPLPWIAFLGLRLWSPLVLSVPMTDIAPVDHLGDIPADVPVLLMRGDHDRTIPDGDFARLVAASPHATVVRFTHSGHADALDQEAAAYRNALLDFVRRIR